VVDRGWKIKVFNPRFNFVMPVTQRYLELAPKNRYLPKPPLGVPVAFF